MSNNLDKHNNSALLECISTDNITLFDEFLLNSEAKTIAFLLELEPERFLYNWYCTSGLTPTAEGYELSWESTKLSNFRGHMFGHYMTALSLAYTATKNNNLRTQLYNKIENCINGIVRCQEAYMIKYPERAGYVAPFSEYWLNNLDGVDSGLESWNQKEEDNPNTLVPWYNLHKIVAGLIDVYKYVKNGDVGEAALSAVCKFIDYVYNCRVSKYTDTQKEKMLGIEYGGIAEALYELYNLTGKINYKKCADGFIETALFNQLAANIDAIKGKHANTAIPKFIGALKKYTVLMQNERYYNELSVAEKEELPMYLTAAKNFFDIVLSGHSYATGGNSVAERFREPDTISTFINHAETHETCNEYNMLKLARELFRLTGNKKYSDYYENTFVNAILASQHPETGDMTYFQPMGSGYNKVFRKEFFWCCTGTGIENFTKLADSIYFKKGNNIYVNLYFSSALKCPDSNLVLRQKSNLPASNKIKLIVSSIDGNNITAKTQVYLRVPEWCAGKPIITRNKFEVTDFSMCDGYIVCTNITNGDEIELELPMEVTVHPLKDNTNIMAFKYGPVILAAQLGKEKLQQTAKTGIMVLRAVRDFSLPSFIVINDGVENWKKNIKQNLVRVNDTDECIIQFKPLATSLKEDVVFVPYNKIYNDRYGLYMNLVAADSQEMMSTILFEKQGLRNEEAASGLLTQIDGNNYEATYNIQAFRSKIGCNGRGFRLARADGWFRYDMPVKQGVSNYLNIIYNQADNGRDVKFLINGEDFITDVIASANSISPDGFYTETREIPAKYTDEKGMLYKTIAGELKPCVTIEFQSTGKESAGIYGISVTHGFDSIPNLSALSFSTGVLHPSFHPDIKEYTLTIAANVQNINMKATPSKMSGLVYDGDILIDDTQPRIIPLNSTIVTLVTYAQNHETQTKYLIKIKNESI